MHPSLFYDTNPSNGIPLIMVEQTRWEESQLQLAEAEKNALMTQGFAAKTGELALIWNGSGLLKKVYVGCGEGAVAKALACAAYNLPEGAYTLEERFDESVLIQWALAQYRFTQYKTSNRKPRVLKVSESIFPSILTEANAIFLVRDLINTPTNELGPQELGDVVSKLAQQYDASFEQWVGDELLRDNFPAIHAVGRASSHEPRLLSLRWGNPSHPLVCLIGKGVCFDSGGLDIKPSTAMRLMKKDMGGAAHVLGLAQWIMENQLPIQLHVLIPAVENAIGPNAFRPGDILTLRNGLRVEVDNTDAEGRLVLADALTKAAEDNPECIIDFATLTGAARVAVGTDIAAMFSNDETIANALLDSAKEVNDPIWRLPLYEDYDSLLDSNVADIANASASPYAGAITAALFLRRFIPKTQAYVHFDIMAWNLSAKPGRPEGGEAMAIRAVGHFLKKRFQV